MKTQRVEHQEGVADAEGEARVHVVQAVVANLDMGSMGIRGFDMGMYGISWA